MSKLAGGVAKITFADEIRDVPETERKEGEAWVVAFLNDSGSVFKGKTVTITKFVHPSNTDPLDHVTADISDGGKTTYWFHKQTKIFWNQLHIHDKKKNTDFPTQYVQIDAKIYNTYQANVVLKNGEDTYWTAANGQAFKWPKNTTQPAGFLDCLPNVKNVTEEEFKKRPGLLPDPKIVAPGLLPTPNVPPHSGGPGLLPTPTNQPGSNSGPGLLPTPTRTTNTSK